MNLGIAIELVLFPFGFEIFFSLLCAFEIQNFLKIIYIFPPGLAKPPPSMGIYYTYNTQTQINTIKTKQISLKLNDI